MYVIGFRLFGRISSVGLVFRRKTQFFLDWLVLETKDNYFFSLMKYFGYK